jgi:hypothetical protein
MALTGHIVSATTYQLRGFELKRQRRMSLRHVFAHDANGTEVFEAPEEPLWLELWIENPSKFPNPGISKDTRSHRLNRELHLGKKTPKGRVVVYCKNRIFIIPCKLVTSFFCVKTGVESCSSFESPWLLTFYVLFSHARVPSQEGGRYGTAWATRAYSAAHGQKTKRILPRF